MTDLKNNAENDLADISNILNRRKSDLRSHNLELVMYEILRLVNKILVKIDAMEIKDNVK